MKKIKKINILLMLYIATIIFSIGYTSLLITNLSFLIIVDILLVLCLVIAIITLLNKI